MTTSHSQVETEAVLDQLAEAGVLTLDGSDETIQLGPRFEEDFEQWLATVGDWESAEAEAEMNRVLPEITVPRVIGDLIGTDDAFVARYLTLAEYLPELPHDSRVHFALLLDHFDTGFPPSDGTPDRFFPVHGEQLDAVLRLYHKAIIYVWRDDCEPCELMKETLNAIPSSKLDGLTLMSVYGPDCPALLQSEFDVVGGPTTLFIKNGYVDTRLYRAPLQSTVEMEISKLLSG